MDWDALKAAWEHNAAAQGGTGLLVIRRGWIVGEWYRGGDRSTAFNIYSSSKSYTSTAYGLILSDFGNGRLPGGKELSLDTKVCNADWLPESLPLPDPPQGGDHRPEPAQHGLGPERREPAAAGPPIRIAHPNSAPSG